MEQSVVAPIIAGIAGFICAFIFSGPLYFGLSKLLSLPTQEEKKNLGIRIFLNFCVFLATAFSISLILQYMSLQNKAHGQSIAFILWFGFIFTSSSIDVIWKGKHLKLWIFESIASLITIQVLMFVLLLFYK
ncbi:DUF1761 family protein [Leptospira haakeii]|uniref:DUF1761 domain-containing protein n=1 Tax=Leptospira haakeii TaxID=2023198 RepID=A0ABX4PNN9_9LEPT|nr:DUF1761 family protein [Leptospira haakeii]PKA16613.1 hypothetical protein CH363_07520 [Leptospira haakeii]PKA20634.1 hypothetical protein CH377_06925 [Leptospira haakeii]